MTVLLEILNFTLEPNIFTYSSNFVPEVVINEVMDIGGIYISNMSADGLTKSPCLESAKSTSSRKLFFYKRWQFQFFPPTCVSELRDDFCKSGKGKVMSCSAQCDVWCVMLIVITFLHFVIIIFGRNRVRCR